MSVPTEAVIAAMGVRGYQGADQFIESVLLTRELLVAVAPMMREQAILDVIQAVRDTAQMFGRYSGDRQLLEGLADALDDALRDGRL